MKDKEKKISKNKEINDLANTLYNRQDKYDLSNPFEVAKCVIDLGYRKLPEDSVVLSKEELNTIQANFFDSGIKWGSKETAKKILNDMYNEILSIEKIYKDKQSKIYSFNDTDGSIVYKMFVDLNLQFCESAKGFIQKHAKQFGVEIKEK